MSGLLEQSRRYHFPLELILVEWNPPGDRPPLRDVLPAASVDDFMRIRYIVVPESVHRRYRRAGEVPLFQMIAKNVGIRRARADFILCTNIDLLFSDQLFRRLVQDPLRDDTYYRCNRCDVPNDIDEDCDLDRQLAWCEKHIMRRQGRNPRFRNISPEALGLQHKTEAKKWLFDKLAIGMRYFWSPGERVLYQLDSFACGDFTLMSRRAWHAIQGYVELDLYSLHVDTLGLIAAAAQNYRQHVFPLDACTYHIDHAAGWSALSPIEKLRFVEERPAIDYSLLREIALYALDNGEQLQLNSDNWGYADMDFEEFALPLVEKMQPHQSTEERLSGN